ncbi:hypothetical protein N7456_006979 [Penicillium angulare]|uniref:Uncharacterized protein n=1 Tax=Penicillium angulare TaxID=116970 RepID=A0A9W9FJ63_9EURO|nr:hypothetical protein N7456_006979 [Penicillium angulare]
MDTARLIQCKGDTLTYILHLESRLIELESAHNTSLESQGSQQLTSASCKPCHVCQNPDRYVKYMRSSFQGSGVKLGFGSQRGHLNDGNQPSEHDNPPSEHDNPPSEIDSPPSEIGSPPSDGNQLSRSKLEICQWEPPPVILSEPPGAVGERKSTIQTYKWEIPWTTSEPPGTVRSVNNESEKRQFVSTFESLPESEISKWLSCNALQRQETLLRLISDLGSEDDDSAPMSQMLSIVLEAGKFMKKAGLMQDLPTKSIKNRPYVCFRELVYCSLCVIALNFTPKSEDVYEAMRLGLGSDAVSHRFQQLIRGAKWANQAIYHLSQTKCGACSWDVIYIGMKLLFNCTGKANVESLAPSRFFCATE